MTEKPLHLTPTELRALWQAVNGLVELGFSDNYYLRSANKALDAYEKVARANQPKPRKKAS